MTPNSVHIPLGPLACLCLVGTAAPIAAQTPELVVEIEHQEIYEGESVLYRVTLNHIDNPKAPKLDSFDSFQITKLGEQSLDSRQITIINGRKSEIVRRGRQYNYRLTPLQTGTLTIPAPTVEIDGETLKGREIVLTVLSPDEQDSVIVEFSADRTSVYPLQPFELSLTVAVRDLPGQLSSRDPLSVLPKPPALNVAWLSDDSLPDGIQPEKSWREILEPLISRQGNGFQINNIGTSSVFSLFQNDAAGFHPKPQRATRKNAKGEDAGYWEYRFARKLIPQKVGRYSFPTVTIKGTFAGDMENGQLVGRRIYALAPGLDITVKDVPLDGRPDSYIGAVGTFDVKAELAPTTASVGDPMTLTVTLTGQGTFDAARPPVLTGLNGIEGAFRTYEATEESGANSRKYTYSLRPLRANVTEFPSIPVAFFDVDAEQYVTMNTESIPVTIRESETLSGSDIISAPAGNGTRSGDLQASEGGVFANDSNLDSVRNEAVPTHRWIGIWSVIVVLWVAASFGIRYAKRYREDPALVRRRSAAARARAALNDARSDTMESLRRAVTGLIADFADVPEAGLTPKDAANQLERLKIDESLCIRTETFLNDCDAARYGAAPEVSRLRAEASDLIDLLIVELRRTESKTSMSGAVSAVIFLAATLLTGGCSTVPDLETSRRFQDAEEAFSQAAGAEEFAQVAGRYREIGGDEFVCGAVLYNQGNAWMRAGKFGRAIAAYRQAQRYRPRDPYLTANLQNALSAAGRDTSATEVSGIAGYVFFWQHWLSYPEKFTVTTFLLVATIIVSLLSQLTQHTVMLRRMTIVAAVCLTLSAASTAWDWHRVEQTIHAVVIEDNVIARKGNSESYQAAFTDALREGTEVVIIEERADWLNVKVGDAGTAWLPLHVVETY